jgi:hypothetical protein
VHANTLVSMFRSIRLISRGASELGLDRPSNWTPGDTTRLRSWVVANCPEAQVARVVRALHDMAPCFTLGGLKHNPLTGLTNAQWAGAPRPDLQTLGQAVSPTVFMPLMRAALAYTEQYSEDIIRAWKWRQDITHRWEQGLAPRRPKRLPADHPARERGISGPVQWEIQQFIDRHGALPAYTEQVGKNGVSGEVAFASIAAMIDNPSLKASATAKQFIRSQLAEGVPLRPGMLPLRVSDVEGPDGRRGPWRESWCWTSIKSEVTALRDAAFIVLLAFTGMRESEASLIPSRRWKTTWHGHPAVTAPLIKTSSGDPMRWWASEAVIRACEILEATQAASAPYLLAGLGETPTNAGRSSRDTATTAGGVAIRRFIARVNTSTALNRAEEIPASFSYGNRSSPEGDAVTPHMLRFTLASIGNTAMLGDFALKEQFKHARLAMTWSYMRNPASETWLDLLTTTEAQDAVRSTVELVADVWAGYDRPRGPAGAQVTREIETLVQRSGIPDIDPSGGDVGEQFLGHVADHPGLLALVRSLAADIHFGTVNHCLYDPAKARCGNAAEPLLGACQPERCANVLIAPAKLRVFEDSLEEIETFTKQRNIPAAQAALLQRRAVDLRRLTNTDQEDA